MTSGAPAVPLATMCVKYIGPGTPSPRASSYDAVQESVVNVLNRQNGFPADAWIKVFSNGIAFHIFGTDLVSWYKIYETHTAKAIQWGGTLNLFVLVVPKDDRLLGMVFNCKDGVASQVLEKACAHAYYEKSGWNDSTPNKQQLLRDARDTSCVNYASVGQWVNQTRMARPPPPAVMVPPPPPFVPSPEQMRRQYDLPPTPSTMRREILRSSSVDRGVPQPYYVESPPSTLEAARAYSTAHRDQYYSRFPAAVEQTRSWDEVQRIAPGRPYTSTIQRSGEPLIVDWHAGQDYMYMIPPTQRYDLLQPVARTAHTMGPQRYVIRDTQPVHGMVSSGYGLNQITRRAEYLDLDSGAKPRAITYQTPETEYDWSDEDVYHLRKQRQRISQRGVSEDARVSSRKGKQGLWIYDGDNYYPLKQDGVKITEVDTDSDARSRSKAVISDVRVVNDNRPLQQRYREHESIEKTVDVDGYSDVAGSTIRLNQTAAATATAHISGEDIFDGIRNEDLFTSNSYFSNMATTNGHQIGAASNGHVISSSSHVVNGNAGGHVVNGGTSGHILNGADNVYTARHDDRKYRMVPAET